MEKMRARFGGSSTGGQKLRGYTASEKFYSASAYTGDGKPVEL